jgi:hypothetical protein
MLSSPLDTLQSYTRNWTTPAGLVVKIQALAVSIGARVAILVAIVREPSRCIFTNYNGVGTQDEDQGYRIIRPEDGYGNVPL